MSSVTFCFSLFRGEGWGEEEGGGGVIKLSPSRKGAILSSKVRLSMYQN